MLRKDVLMPDTDKRRLIEVSLPLKAISDLSARE